MRPGGTRQKLEKTVPALTLRGPKCKPNPIPLLLLQEMQSVLRGVVVRVLGSRRHSGSWLQLNSQCKKEMKHAEGI